MVTVYAIAYSDGEYDSILPLAASLPRNVYTKLDGAEAALKEWVKTFSKFTPVLYGEAYPYDKTTPAEELAKKGRALYGWVEVQDDDSLERYCVCIVALKCC